MSHSSGTSQIIAVGDLHGNFDGLRAILKHCGVIDAKERWAAQGTRLVLLGDVLGRGGAPGKIFRLVKRLEQEAPGHGSRVHLLLGNHEAMSISGMIMYNTAEEFRDLAEEDFLGTADAGETEAAAVRAESRAQGRAQGVPAARRLDLMGARAFKECLSPEGRIGFWLSNHDSAVAIDGFLFVHGGLNREFGLIPLEELNARVRNELFLGTPAMPRSSDELADAEAGGADWTAGSTVLRRDGPQWNRDFTLHRGPEREAELAEVLKYHGCQAMVVGHTPTKCIDPAQAGKILSIYGGKMHCIDTGIGRAYGERLSALRIRGGEAVPVYP